MSTFDDPDVAFDDPVVAFDEGATGDYSPVTRVPGGRFTYRNAQELQTNALIDLYGKSIILNRLPEFVEDNEGGLVRPSDVPTALSPQQFYFETASPIAHVARGASYTQPAGEGQRVTINYVLLGRRTADVKQRDKFVLGDYEYQVIYVHPDKRYQVKAEVELITFP